MKSILIIIPNISSFPKQFKFWLQSAYNNSTVDFLLITDQVLESRDNAKIVPFTFAKLKSLLQAKFDYP